MQVLLLDPASERDAAPGRACAGPARRTRCTWSAGAWAAASAARSRSRRSSPASPRSRRSKLGRPVKLRLDRDDDFMITGRRHCFQYEYEVGYDDDGRMLGAEMTMVSRAGFSADLSGPVMTRAMCHFDNAYWLPDVAIHGYSGAHQHAEQHRLPRLRRPAGRDRDREHPRLDRAEARQGSARRAPRSTSTAVGRERNVTPYGQVRRRQLIHELVAELEAQQRLPGATRGRSPRSTPRAQCLKRGLALTPVKFGISFNVVHLNQAGALVHVYGDGSMLVNHGGTEMGQGLNTKVAQVVAHELGVELRDACAATRHRHAQGRQHLGHRGLDRQRPERQGRAGRGAADPRPARRLRRRALRRSPPPTCASPTTRSTVGRPQDADFRELVVERLHGARAALVRRLLRHARAALEQGHDAGPALLLLRLRRGRERGRRRHAHRRMEAAARRRAARRRQLAEPGDRHRPGRGRASSRAWAG